MTALIATVVGCHDPSAEIARESAERQAEQNQRMARVTGEAAAGARRLIEEHGRGQREAFAAHRELHAERSQLTSGWNELEAQRQVVAQSRRTESALAAIVHGGGAALAAILALGIAWLTLFGLSRHDAATEAAYEVLIDNLASDASRLGCGQAIDANPPLLQQDLP